MSVTTARFHKLDCRNPHVLVVDRDEGYGNALVAALRARDMCAIRTSSVDDFLDLNCRLRVDLVCLEVDVLDPFTLDNLCLLRTHFGEGPSTRIVAVTSFAPHAFPHLLQQRGADDHLSKSAKHDGMAEQIETQIRKKFDNPNQRPRPGDS